MAFRFSKKWYEKCNTLGKKWYEKCNGFGKKWYEKCSQQNINNLEADSFT
jgi:hypothetical protein